MIKKEPVRNVQFMPSCGELAFDEDIPFIPHFTTQQQFQNDVLSMYMPKPAYKQRFPLKNVDLAKQVNEPFPLKVDVNNITSREMIEAEIMHKFFRKFPKTKLYKQIMETFEYDSEECAKFTLALLTARAQNKNTTISTILSETLIDANNSRMSAYLPTFGGGMEGGKGTYNVKELKRMDRIAKIAKELNIRYKTASRKHSITKESIHPADDMEPRNIRSQSELPLPVEMAQDEEVYDNRLVNHELKTAQHYEHIPIAKKYVMLVDVSASMWDNCRCDYACASAISLVTNALEGMNEVTVMLFDEGIPGVKKFTSREEIVDVMLKTPFSGGGTDIGNALREMDKVGADECILITDGGGNVDYIPKTKTFTIFVDDYENRDLKKCSYSYERVIPQTFGSEVERENMYLHDRELDQSYSIWKE